MSDEAPRFESFDMGLLDREKAYQLLNGAVIPRPIAFVTTVGATVPGMPRIVNGSPYSSLITLSPSPPLLGFIIGGATHSDTLVNLYATGEFVIHSVSEAMAERVERCAGAFPAHISEVDAVGFSTVESDLIAPPRIQQSPIHFECKLDRIIELGDVPDRLIVGRVLRTHVDSSVINGFRINPRSWQPLGRIAGGTFCRVGDLIRVP